MLTFTRASIQGMLRIEGTHQWNLFRTDTASQGLIPGGKVDLSDAIDGLKKAPVTMPAHR